MPPAADAVAPAEACQGRAPLRPWRRAAAIVLSCAALGWPRVADAAPDATLRATFIGTATLLVRYAGFTILTDPNFVHRGDKVHLGYGLHAERLTDPAIDIDALPPLDAVVLSHYHGDHFDRVAEARLDRGVPIVTTPHAADRLRPQGFTATRPLEPWQATTFRKNGARLVVTAMPGRHGPVGVAALLPPVMGSLLELTASDGAPPLRVYISGDTLVYDDIRDIPKRHPDVAVAFLHLGGTRVGGILVTMDAAQGVEMLRIIRPRVAVPIHYDDYTVFKSPLADFQRAVDAAGLGDRVRYVARGETVEIDAGASIARPR